MERNANYADASADEDADAHADAVLFYLDDTLSVGFGCHFRATAHKY